MIRQEIVTYINQCRNYGYDDEKIRSALKQSGWSDADISDSFADLASLPASSSIPPAPPVPSISSLVDAERSSVGSERKNLFSSSTGSGGGAMNYGVENSGFRGKKTFVALAAAILVLAGGAAGSWYYYDSLPGRVFALVNEKMSSQTNFKYKARVKIRLAESKNKVSAAPAPVQSDVNSLKTETASLFGALAGFLGGSAADSAARTFGEQVVRNNTVDSMPMFIPSELKDVELEFRASGAIDQSSESQGSFSMQLDASMKQEKNVYGVGFEIRSIKDLIYLRLVELPIPFLSLTTGIPFSPLDITNNFLKKWFVIKPDILGKYGITFNKESASAEFKKTQERIKPVIVKYKLTDLFETLSVDRKSSSAGLAAYRFDLKPRPDQLGAFLKEMVEAREDRALTKSEEDSFVKMIEGLNKGSVNVYVGKDDGLVHGASFILPDYDYFGMTASLDFNFELSDFGIAAVEEPQGAADFSEAVKKIESAVDASMNDSRMKSRDAQRVANIKQVQLALELYFDKYGQYPPDLAKLASEFMPIVPTDPTDKSMFVYSFHVSDGRIKGGLSKGMRDGYHLGASLEGASNYLLSGDRDCNSLTGAGCAYSTGYNKVSAFDGSDAAGCRKEPDRHCYDQGN